MGKPIIGVVARIEKVDNPLYNRNVMSVIEDYRRAIILSGGIPVMIMPTEDIKFSKFKEENYISECLNENIKDDLIKQINLCDGILMPGGCKVFEYDKFICKYALDNDIPLLGICLGMQIMSIVDNNNINVVEKINNGVNHKSLDTFVHNVKLDENSNLFNIVGNKEFKINSRHVCNVTSIKNFDVVGYSNDGIIEAIEYKKNKFAIGVQWHPESIYDESIESQRLFTEFIKKCQ